jgi:SAM-dependent methyltransferase
MLEFSLQIKEMAWVERTPAEVDFVVAALGLQGKERILDLACGFGRHSLELAKRGYDVVGVDIEHAFIEDAKREAAAAGLDVEFVEGNVLDVSYYTEFDVVLNLADGAIGYFPTDEENLRLFDIVARALRPDGHHLMGTCSAAHARAHFPKRAWQAGRRALTLADFRFNRDTSRMFYRDHVLRYGVPLQPLADTFEDDAQTGIRLYDVEELTGILRERGLWVVAAYGGYDRATAASAEHLMQIVCSRKA